MAAIKNNIGNSVMTFSFTGDDGYEYASFRVNPTDVKLAKRFQEVGEYFKNIGDRLPENASLDDVFQFNEELEEKVCQLLGYDAKQSLFGQVSATSIMEDGNLFVLHVFNVIAEKVAPELQKRKQSMANAVAKHTAKYQ